MKAVILAGGYAKRLQPLTNNAAKPLLPVKGKPIIDHIMEKIEELKDTVDEVIVFTNEKFRGQFEGWLKARQFNVKVEIIAEPSRSEDEKFGAIRALSWLITNYGLDDDCLIIAGDNLFTSGLKPIVEYYFKNGKKPLIAVYDVKNLELVKHYSAVKIDSDTQRVIDFSEKPEKPETTLVSTCIYLMPKSILKLFNEYLKEGNNPDSPGYFIRWLHKKVEVYGYGLQGFWTDIGTPETYEKAKQSIS